MIINIQHRTKNVSIGNVIVTTIIILLFMALIFFLTSDLLHSGGIPVEATVTNARYFNGSPQWYATYTVDGQTYTEKISGNTNGLYKGKKITLYYSQYNPCSITHNIDRTTATFLRIGFSSIALSYIITNIVYYINFKKRWQNLNENGKSLQSQNLNESAYQNPYENNSESNYSYYNSIGKF